jgi:5-methylthioadenosine/S-adenosylhomocysteine deaminase
MGSLAGVLAALFAGGCRPDVAGGAPADMAAGSDASVVPGAPDHFLLVGIIVTPDQVIDGELLVEGAKITCVAAGDQCSMQAGAAGATVVDTHGIIAPGMIDTHNHILFDIFDEDDWKPAKVYTNHNDWTSEPRYAAMLDVKQCLVNDSQGKPTWCANTPYGTAAGSLRCEVDKFGELKGLVAGTTSIVGLPGTSAACFGSVARSIDVSQNELMIDKIQTSATFPPSKTSADGVCSNFASGTTTAYLIHCGEGTDARALAEFSTLSSATTTPGCLLAPQTTITHGTAFGATEFASMAQHGMKLTWSPASNVSLYAATADIPKALAAGVEVALAPDWSMGGSQNLLDEMRFADAWDNAHFGDRLAAQDLLAMTTTHAADALALGDKIGKLAVGYFADLAVYAGDTSKPYDAVLAATPKDVQLVMVGGAVLYGDPALMAAAAAVQPPCETIDVCGAPKLLCIATTTATDKLGQSYADIKAALDQALTAADAQTTADGYNFAPLPPLVKCP